MTRKRYAQSNAKAASTCWEIDLLAVDHPAKTIICNCWELMQKAIDRLSETERLDAIREIVRRAEARRDHEEQKILEAHHRKALERIPWLPFNETGERA